MIDRLPATARSKILFNHLFVRGFAVWMNLLCPDDVAFLRLPFEELVETIAKP